MGATGEGVQGMLDYLYLLVVVSIQFCLPLRCRMQISCYCSFGAFYVQDSVWYTLD